MGNVVLEDKSFRSKIVFFSSSILLLVCLSILNQVGIYPTSPKQGVAQGRFLCGTIQALRLGKNFPMDPTALWMSTQGSSITLASSFTSDCKSTFLKCLTSHTDYEFFLLMFSISIVIELNFQFDWLIHFFYGLSTFAGYLKIFLDSKILKKNFYFYFCLTNRQ